jgi:hypothetical protein
MARRRWRSRRWRWRILTVCLETESSNFCKKRQSFSHHLGRPGEQGQRGKRQTVLMDQLPKASLWTKRWDHCLAWTRETVGRSCCGRSQPTKRWNVLLPLRNRHKGVSRWSRFLCKSVCRAQVTGPRCQARRESSLSESTTMRIRVRCRHSTPTMSWKYN